MATASPGAPRGRIACTMVSTWSGVATCLVSPSALHNAQARLDDAALLHRTCCMRMRLLLIAALLPCRVLLGARAAARTVMVFGDSLSAAYGLRQSEGWVSLLGERIARRGSTGAWSNASISRRDDRRRTAPPARGPQAPQALHRRDRARRQRRRCAACRWPDARQPRDDHPAPGGRSAEPVLVGLMIPPELWHRLRAEFRGCTRSSRARAASRARAVPARRHRRQAASSSRRTSCIRRPRRSRASSTTSGRCSSPC